MQVARSAVGHGRTAGDGATGEGTATTGEGTATDEGTATAGEGTETGTLGVEMLVTLVLLAVDGAV